jgi:ribose-phosphate pyrophosphokinase
MITPPKVDFSNYLQVFPDEGAMLRYRGDEKLNVICNKVRDPQTGHLTGFKILNPEVIENNPDKPFMVIDDLCDGGGTFAGIASLLNEYNRKKSIYVTHMVNPKGIKTLTDNYDQVLFTNSYKNWFEDIIPNNVTVVSVI